MNGRPYGFSRPFRACTIPPIRHLDLDIFLHQPSFRTTVTAWRWPGGEERGAAAAAVTDCEVLVLNRSDFFRLLESRADLCMILLRNPVPAAAADQRTSRGHHVSRSRSAGRKSIVATRRVRSPALAEKYV